MIFQPSYITDLRKISTPFEASFYFLKFLTATLKIIFISSTPNIIKKYFSTQMAHFMSKTLYEVYVTYQALFL